MANLSGVGLQWLMSRAKKPVPAEADFLYRGETAPVAAAAAGPGGGQVSNWVVPTEAQIQAEIAFLRSPNPAKKAPAPKRATPSPSPPPDHKRARTSLAPAAGSDHGDALAQRVGRPQSPRHLPVPVLGKRAVAAAAAVGGPARRVGGPMPAAAAAGADSTSRWSAEDEAMFIEGIANYGLEYNTHSCCVDQS